MLKTLQVRQGKGEGNWLTRAGEPQKPYAISSLQDSSSTEPFCA